MAPATFQRMKDQILWGTETFAAAYLGHLKEVFHQLKTAGLTIRPDKCALAKQEIHYLGFVLGHGVVRPQVGKVESIKNAEKPMMKKQVRSLLGLIGRYWRFIPNFLKDLTKKCQHIKVNWTTNSRKHLPGLERFVVQKASTSEP